MAMSNNQSVTIEINVIKGNNVNHKPGSGYIWTIVYLCLFVIYWLFTEEHRVSLEAYVLLVAKQNQEIYNWCWIRFSSNRKPIL